MMIIMIEATLTLTLKLCSANLSALADSAMDRSLFAPIVIESLFRWRVCGDYDMGPGRFAKRSVIENVFFRTSA